MLSLRTWLARPPRPSCQQWCMAPMVGRHRAGRAIRSAYEGFLFVGVPVASMGGRRQSVGESLAPYTLLSNPSEHYLAAGDGRAHGQPLVEHHHVGVVAGDETPFP